jgi:hypothetical protein
MKGQVRENQFGQLGPQVEPRFGALVLSLDFELRWGDRDLAETHPQWQRILLESREAVLRLLEMFAEFEVAATWATVGFLFCSCRDELEAFTPALKPTYLDQGLNPYGERLKADEAADPLHFAPSLVRAIAGSPRQELATHTFSHFCCLEPGQTAEQFDADLKAAVEIAAKYGVTLRSIVFPRNQYNPAYAAVLEKHGMIAYRGNETGWMYRGSPTLQKQRPLARGSRLLDSYLNITGNNLTPWSRIRQGNGLYNIASSRYMRRYMQPTGVFERLRLGRVRECIRAAARDRQVCHLWTHPHDLAACMQHNLGFLRQILSEFAECREKFGMRSLTMLEVAERCGASPLIPESCRNESGCA